MSNATAAPKRRAAIKPSKPAPPPVVAEPEAPPPIDPHAVIHAAEADIASLTGQRQRLAAAVLRHEAGATERYSAVEERLAGAQRVLALAHDAVLALADEAAQEVVQQDAAEVARLEGERVAGARLLADRLDTVERAVQGLAGTVQKALAASDSLYNTGTRLGIHGRATGTRDAIETRVQHVLRMAGLPAFDLGRGPAARSPLGNAKPDQVYVQPFIEPRPPLPDRRDVYDVPVDAYPGANPNQYPIKSTELRDPVTGAWVSVPPGSIDFPPGHVTGIAPPPTDLPDLAELEAEAEERRQRHRDQDAAGRAAARAVPLLEGETRRDG